MLQQYIQFDVAGSVELDLDDAFPGQDHVTAAEIIEQMKRSRRVPAAIGTWNLPVSSP